MYSRYISLAIYVKLYIPRDIQYTVHCTVYSKMLNITHCDIKVPHSVYVISYILNTYTLNIFQLSCCKNFISENVFFLCKSGLSSPSTWGLAIQDPIPNLKGCKYCN